MRFRHLAAAAALFFANPAFAQNPGTVTANAFAIGKGAGKTGFTSVLCTQAQIAIGQNAANPICAALSGDVTMTAAGVTAIGANKVTNSMLATAADGTIKSNISGGTASPSDNGISAVLDKLFGTTRGSIVYRGASGWAALTPGTSGFFYKSNGPGADPAWAAAPGSGTVTNVATAGLATGGPITTTGTVTVTAATQSDQETSTSTTTAVTPGVQQFHPSAAKAWVKFTTTGANGAQTVNASYNVSGVSRTSSGHYVVTFTTAFSSANYAASVTSLGGNLIGNPESQAAGSCGITYFTGAPAVADPTSGYAVFFGDQ